MITIKTYLNSQASVVMVLNEKASLLLKKNLQIGLTHLQEYFFFFF